MRYEKPELVVLTSALAAIQGSGDSKIETVDDAAPPLTSAGAYEADE